MRRERSWSVAAAACLACGVFVLALPAAQPPDEVWSKVYDSGAANGNYGVVPDGSGGCYVTGWSNNGGGGPDKCRSYKYDAQGNMVWNHVYDSTSTAASSGPGITADDAGNVYVSGYTFAATADFLLIKFSPTGTVMYERLFDSGNAEWSRAIASDGVHAVYLAGDFESGSGNGIEVVKCDTAGNLGWRRTYDTPANEQADGAAFDRSSGMLYVVGTSDPTGSGPTDALTVKYDTSGLEQWHQEYDTGDFDEALGVAVDDSGFVHVAVASYDTIDITTGMRVVTYRPDGTIRSYWTAHVASYEYAEGIAVDHAGFIYLIAEVHGGVGDDWLTAKFDQQGSLVWNKTFDSGLDDRVRAIAVDDRGYVYVTGFQGTWPADDARTTKYAQYLSISGKVTGAAAVDVTLTGAVTRTVTTGPDGSYAFTDLPCDKDYTVTPTKPGVVFDPPSRDYAPLGTDQLNQDYANATGVADRPSAAPERMLLEVAAGRTFTVRCAVPVGEADLAVYDAGGRRAATLVHGYCPAGTREYCWTPPGAGVWFVRLFAGDAQLTAKAVALR